jgi:DNA repair protein RecN (Recombination protein N)
MLRELRIRDFAIIDDLTLTFREGLNVITGETGAGKSIILRALALLCGGRAAPDLIRSSAPEASIEGLFDSRLPAEVLEPFGLAPDDDLLLRRQIARTGKGRIHVNGSPATLALLDRFGDHLVHIYGQRDQSLLLRPQSHLDFLDRFGDLSGRRGHMHGAHAALVAARRRLQQLEAERSARNDRADLLGFQIQELAGARVRSDEEAELGRRRELIRHAERIARLCAEGEATLYSGEAAMAGELARLAARLSELRRVVPDLFGPIELIETARVQLEEAARDLGATVQKTQFDPAELDEVEERLALLKRLSRKYGVPSPELPALLTELEAEQARLETRETDLAAARAAVAECEREALVVAHDLSAARAETAGRLEAEMQGELAVLGMPDARFRVVREAATTDGDIDASGIDRLDFHLSANPGEPPLPLARIASGGELSRIMLALKALTAFASGTSILIFDEVDAGIGGAVADAVGLRLKKIASTRQLLCITHLPQIAAYADHHYCVEKHSRRGRTVAEARLLEPADRVRELSRMLGGIVAPAEAERYAHRLMAQGQRGLKPTLP